jgi:predicted negative regulator of RcsB-dependent stress response
MAYDIEEQESLSALKGWLEENANTLIVVIVVAVLAVAGSWGWRWYVQKEASAAAVLFDEYTQAVDGKDESKARDTAAALMRDHASSAFAAFAALAQARVNVGKGDTTAAKAQLHFVIDRSGSAELVTLARVRLAGVLLDEKAYDEGLAVLAPEAPAALAAEVSDRRGDLLLAQGKPAEARAAYAKALEEAGAQNPLRSLIQTKLDALPGAG